MTKEKFYHYLWMPISFKKLTRSQEIKIWETMIAIIGDKKFATGLSQPLTKKQWKDILKVVDDK